MAHGSISPDAIRRLVDAEWSAGVPSADPDDPQVRGFAEFGLPPDSPLATEDWLHRLQAWRNRLQIPANSVFLDGTLLMTVEAGAGYLQQRLRDVDAKYAPIRTGDTGSRNR